MLFDMPPKNAWVTYGEWTKVYGNRPCLYPFEKVLIYYNSGDMIYFEILGKKYLVLNSLKRTNDLFEKRSSNYSDRVKMPMLIDL